MITSTSNKSIKNITLLLKKSAERRRQGVFVVEGERLLFETPHELLQAVYASESFLANETKAEALKALFPAFEAVSDEVFKKMSDTVTPQGVIGVVQMPEWSIEDALKPRDGGDTPLILILNGVQDPGNLGTMVRTGEGAGVSAVIADAGTVDLFNPKVVRATMGSIFRVPFIVSDDLTATMSLLKDKGVSIYAAHLKGSMSYTQPDYKKPTAFVIGNEGNGITDEVAAACSTLIKIPMRGSLESLNAAMSAGILMYEAAR